MNKKKQWNHNKDNTFLILKADQPHPRDYSTHRLDLD